MSREQELVDLCQTLIDVHKQVVMDTPEQRELHDRAIETFQDRLDMEKRFVNNPPMWSSPMPEWVPKFEDNEEGRKFLAESESLTEELFDLADYFRIPVTNNIPWYEGLDRSKPVYHVGDFIEAVLTAVFRHPEDLDHLREKYPLKETP